MDALKLAQVAREALLDRKGADVLLLDLRGCSPVSDFLLIASGDSPPQLKAMANEVQRVLKRDGVVSYHRAGGPDDGWVVLDYVDVVIHVFLRRVREYYAIEELWESAPRIP